jgi:RND family efflux transporter MFP subunit
MRLTHASASMVACTAFLLGCGTSNTYQKPEAPNVTVAKPVQMDVTTYIEEIGVTQAVQTVDIRARVEGYLEKIHVEDGEDVTAGQVLFEIDKRPFQAEVDRAQAAVVVAQAEKTNAEAKYKRSVPLAEKGAVSQEELAEDTAAFEVAKAMIDVREAELKKAQLDLSYTGIKSPIKGRMGGRLIDQGNFVGRTLSTHLATVISYDPIYATFNISETDLLRLMGQGPRRPEDQELDKSKIKFYMSLQDEEDFPHVGQYNYADLGVESSTGTYLIRGTFPNPEPRIIAPGMTVTVRVPTGVLEDALLIPEAAIASDQRGRYVMIVNSENKVERRDVRLGVKVLDMMVVTEGLEPEDRVITQGLQRAREGGEVRIDEELTLEPPTAGVLPPPGTEPSDEEPPAEQPPAASEPPTKAAPATDPDSTTEAAYQDATGTPAAARIS